MQDDPSRTTPLGMARYSHEFIEAALAVEEKIGNRQRFEIVAPIPVLYLIGHSIELSLKSQALTQHSIGRARKAAQAGEFRRWASPSILDLG